MKRTAMLVLALVGCGDSGRERVQIPVMARGVAPRTVALGDAQLTLTRADVAFGPAYFCASEAARAELCSVALAELREAVLVHALDPTPQPAGTLTGTSGEVRSAIYDHGIAWLLTESAPRVLSGAPEGHSAVIEGDVARAGRTLHFRATIDVRPRARGEASVNAQRTRYVVDDEGARLQIGMDPHVWVDRLDADALFALDTDGDGAVVLDPSSSAYEGILQGMLSRGPMRFEWSAP